MRRTLFCITRFASLALLVTLLSSEASAQFKASIQGTVTDSNGAVISGAKITLVNKETGRKLTTSAGESGFYRITGLAPGEYQVIAERDGFKKSELKEIAISAETDQGVDIMLEPGQVSETVTISGDSTPRLQTENASVDRGITEREFRDLPQFGRDPYELARLAPGVFGLGARAGNGGAVNLPNTTGPGGSIISIFQVENVVPISANGQRVSANNFTIDGVSVNSLSWGGAAVVTPSQESVKEMRISSTSYSAEDGRNSGAQIKVISQNGGNQLHGSAFFKYNDPGLNSFNKYGGITGNPLINAPPVREENKFRQFGGSLGGPVFLPRFGEGGKPYFNGKNKLFFFFTYEGLRQRTNNTYNAWIETEQYRNQVITDRPNSVTAKILTAAGPPRIVQLLRSDCSVFTNEAERNRRCRTMNGGLDLGRLTGAVGDYVSQTGGGFDDRPDVVFAQLLAPRRDRGDQYNLRFDYNLSEKHSFAFSSYFTKRNDFVSDRDSRTRESGDLMFAPINSSAMVTWNYIVSPRMLNEARFNFTRFSSDQLSDSPNANFGIPRVEVEDLPFDRIRFGPPRNETTPAVFAQNTFDFRDVVSLSFGNLAAKYGVEIRREQANSNLLGGARPLYSFQGLFNLANDTPIFEAINADPNTGLPANAQRYFRFSDYSLFGQHDWKMRPNFTLNLGLRWEYFTPLRDTRGQVSNLFLGSNGLANSQLRVVDQLHNPDRNNFGPRIGFAYSPKLFKDKLVWRGGFGVAYNRAPGAPLNNMRGNPPFFARHGLCCGTANDRFAGGRIQYVTGASDSIFSYPVNPMLAGGIDPATGGVRGSTVEVYATPQDSPNAYVYTWSLDAQYELPLEMTATLGYQASAGHKLIRIVPYHLIFTNLMTNPPFRPVFVVQPDVNSNFNAMNATLSKRFGKGFQFQANYRWSKSIDTLSFEGPGGVTNQTNPSDLGSERGPSDFDVTHHFTFAGLWELPIFRGRKDALGYVIGGWKLNGIVTRSTGFPWTPKLFENLRQPSGESFGPIRPILYRGGALDDASDDAFIRPGGNFPGGGATFFSTTVNRDSSGVATLALNPPGIGRNSFRGPRHFRVDLSAHKEFRFPKLPGLGEGTKLDLRANFFNAFNLLNLNAFNFFDPGVHVRSPNFGRAPGGMAGRVIEFQARFSF